jgi:hypothetical protein
MIVVLRLKAVQKLNSGNVAVATKRHLATPIVTQTSRVALPLGMKRLLS